MRHSAARFVLCLTFVLVLTSGCASAQPAAAPQAIPAATPAGAAVQPAPTAAAQAAPTAASTAAATQPPAASTSASIALKVSGKVNKEMGWSEEEVRAMKTVQVQSKNKQGKEDSYTGVPLSALLEQAGVQADATKLVFTGSQGETAEAAWTDVQACADCIVSFRNKGGFSLVMPGLSDDVQIKGVVAIEVK